MNQVALLGNQQFPSFDDLDPNTLLPAFIRVFPSKFSAQDIRFLREKGSTTLPGPALQNALLQAYAEYVHPYMPLLDLQEFLAIVNARDGSHGQVSLLLYQAAMFAATAFVNMKHIRDAGFTSRKAARRTFFQKARVSCHRYRPCASAEGQDADIDFSCSCSTTSITSRIVLSLCRDCSS